MTRWGDWRHLAICSFCTGINIPPMVYGSRFSAFVVGVGVSFLFVELHDLIASARREQP